MRAHYHLATHAKYSKRKVEYDVSLLILQLKQTKKIPTIPFILEKVSSSSVQRSLS